MKPSYGIILLGLIARHISSSSAFTLSFTGILNITLLYLVLSPFTSVVDQCPTQFYRKLSYVISLLGFIAFHISSSSAFMTSFTGKLHMVLVGLVLSHFTSLVHLLLRAVVHETFICY